MSKKFYIKQICCLGTVWKKIGVTLFNLPSFFKSLSCNNSQLKIYMYEDDNFLRSINHITILTKEIPS